MDTIDEMIYYCKELNPVGTLMLTGEWGCGKTYLVENDLKEKLKDTHILVRISLFGIDSIDALNAAVKRNWIESCSKILWKLDDKKKAVKATKQIFGTAGMIAGCFIPWVKDATEAALSINPYDYISINPVVKVGDSEKRIVLIFDDLERSKLDTIDLLGCINEYCENMHFNTIIIANEEKIKAIQGKEESEEEKETVTQTQIKYEEIKEKIVQRTIWYKPDYNSIIHSLIENQEGFKDGYKQFLQKNEALLIGIFKTDPIKDDDKFVEAFGKPHNLRSLICALHEFNRVYKKLNEREMPKKENFLYSFIAYTIADKAGIAVHGKYGFLVSDGEIKKLYPWFDPRFLLEGVRQWIKNNNWDEEAIDDELEELKKSLSTSAPKDLLKVNSIFNLNDKTVADGFPGLLLECYEGKLTLNEYVIFIENSYRSRHFEINCFGTIDWNKVMDGIDICFNRYIVNNEREIINTRIIGDDYRHFFIEKELKAYDKIASFRKNETVLYENNKKDFLESINRDKVRAFILCQNKRYKSFDVDMANVIADCFSKCEGYERAQFAGAFNGMWGRLDHSIDANLEESKVGLEKLRERVEEIKAQYESSGQAIAAFQADRFLNTIKELSEKVSVAMEDKEEDVIIV